MRCEESFRTSWKLILFVFVSLLLTLGIGITAWAWSWQDKIFPGVKIGNISVGGFTREQALERLMPVQEELLSAPVTIVLGEQVWQLKRRDLGYQLSVEKVVEQAYQLGRRGSLWSRLLELERIFRGTVNLPLVPVLDKKKATSVLEGLVREFITLPEDASLRISDKDEVVVVPGKPGTVLDVEASLKLLENLRSSFVSQVVLRLKEQQPRITAEYIKGMKIRGLLSSYTTYFDVNNVNRTYNIHVAADALDNQFVKPGEVFSFNRVVGPRSKEKGYKEALIVSRDEFVPGIGGGVCQVSSTLYNAVLLAGLEIVERSNHSLPVSYVPLGRDATVVYGWRDLKFRNNTSGYLLIRTQVRGGALTVKIFGNTEEKKNARLEVVVDEVLEPKVITKEDANLYQGKTVVEQEGSKGYKVRVYRYLNKGGKIEKQLVSRDLYNPLNKVVRVGTMPVPKAPAPPAPHEELLSPLLPPEQNPREETPAEEEGQGQEEESGTSTSLQREMQGQVGVSR